MIKNTLTFIVIMLVALTQRTTVKAQSNAKTKPNILVIITDDQRYNTIHALGNNEILTPNMDKLVKEGTTFTQAHIMGGLRGDVCCPSRAMIMSGKTVFHLHQGGGFVPTTDTTFPELFRAHGYTTFATGKWHQDKASFNRSFSSGENIFFGGMNPPETGGQYRPLLNHYDTTGKYNSPFWGNHFSSIYFADAAVDFLEQQKNNQQPFLMYVAFTSPHDPRTPPTWYGHSYQTDDVSLPPSFLPEHPFDNGELRVRDEMLLPFPRTKEAVKTELAKYYSMISEVDYQIGKVIEALKKTGKYQNTIIVFAGDNGLAAGDHGLLGKQNCYESAIRVPLVFVGPQIPKSKQVNNVVYLNDIYPTLCTLTGINIPATVESKSLTPAFGGIPLKGKNIAFYAYINQQRAIVDDGFKLISYNVDGKSRTQLFNLNNDPEELHDLSGEAGYQNKISALSLLLGETMHQLDDPCDFSKPAWGFPKKWSFKEVLNLNP